MLSTKKAKSKPSEEGKKKKIRRERSPSPTLEERRRRSKRRLLKLAEESSFSKANDAVSAIVVELIKVADTATTPYTPSAPRSARPLERRIIIREPAPKEPTPKKVPVGKRKKKLKEAPIIPLRDSTLSPIKRSRREAKESKLREEAWLQKQRNRATGVEAFEQRSSSISQEVEQHFVVVIKDQNPLSILC